MEAKIAAYQRENRDNILQNDARKVMASLLFCDNAASGL